MPTEKGKRSTALFLKDHLLENIMKEDGPIENSPCWIWQRAIGGNGYGYMKWNGDLYLAHRLSYKTFRGELSGDLFCLHGCDRPICINPDHLRLGTPADNVADMYARGRNRKEKAA
jgi:hypothetical protein